MHNGKNIDLSTGNVVETALTDTEILEVQAREEKFIADNAASYAAEQAVAQARAEAQADNIVQYLRDHTPLECEQYVENNTATLAATRALLKKMAMVLCVLAKESL